MPVETCRRCDSICHYSYYDYTNYTHTDIIKHFCSVKEANISIKDIIIHCCWNNKDIQCSGTSSNVVRYDYLLHLCCFKQKTTRGAFLNKHNNKRT
jgi:hypothetical protein